MSITCLELFWIGLGIGISIPCLVTCLPLLIPITIGKQSSWKSASLDIFFFSAGRLFAYTFLGLLAGISGYYLNRILNSEILSLLRILASLIIFLIGILIILGQDINISLCKILRVQLVDRSAKSLTFLGFTIGMLPCAPLLALFFEITVISKNILSAILYAISFGLGTASSTFLILATITGTLSFIPLKFFTTQKSKNILRILCGLLLIIISIKFLPFSSFHQIRPGLNFQDFS